MTWLKILIGALILLAGGALLVVADYHIRYKPLMDDLERFLKARKARANQSTNDTEVQ